MTLLYNYLNAYFMGFYIQCYEIYLFIYLSEIIGYATLILIEKVKNGV